MPNEAVDRDRFQAALPPGIGILLAGVSGHTIAKNTVEGNDFVGIAVLGWCTANAGGPERCDPRQPVIDGCDYDPAVSDNLVSQNKVSGNGSTPSTPADRLSLAVDLLYVQFEPGTVLATASRRTSRVASRSSPPSLSFSPTVRSGPLPTDGCKKP